MGFEGLLEAVPDALVCVDQSGTIRLVNHHAESLFGYERGELLGAPLSTLVPEQVRQIHPVYVEGYHAHPRTRLLGTDLKLSGQRRDGTEFPVDIALSPLDTEEGSWVIAAVRDMTYYRSAEAERRRLDRVAAIVESSDDAITSSTPEGIVTTWNPAAELIYGYSAAEMIGQSVQVLYPGEGQEEIKAIETKIRAGQAVENVQIMQVRKDGTAFPVSITISPIRGVQGEVTGISAISRDVTEQRKAIEAAERMAAIVENSEDAIYGTTLDAVITMWNPAAERMYGWQAREIVGRSVALLYPQGRAAEMRSVHASVAAGRPVQMSATIRLRRDGTTFPVSLSVSPIRGDAGSVIGASTIARDLTSQIAAARRYRSMMEASLDSMVAISPAGKITDANAATVKLTGVPRDNLIGTSFSDYFTDPTRAEEIYQRVFAVGVMVDYPLTLRRRPGHETVTEVRYNASVYRDAAGEVLGVFAAARDVTDQLHDHEQLAKQQTEALERLAELERFQRVTVGRELRMLDLKKEVKLLTKEIDYLKKEIEYLRRPGPASGGEPDDKH